jgi:glycosyltransferase involved in cell wall biosynthesis
MSSSIPLLTIVVPAWNEAANLPICLSRLHATFAGSSYEIVVIDDGSQDETLAVAQRLAAEQPEQVRVLAHDGNQGFGAALRTGFGAARGRYVTCCPADFEMTPAGWSPFASALGQADVVVGRRIRREGYNLLMRFNSWLYPKLVRALFGLPLCDVNWISVYRRELVQCVAITQSGIPMLVEILIKLRDLGATFREVDCRMQPRRIGKPSAARFRVMWRTFIGLLKLWWNYRLAKPKSTAFRDPNLHSD